MSTQGERAVTSAIQRYEGTPNKRGRREEAKKWARFRDWFIGWFKKGDELGAEYAIAKVNEAQAEASIKQEQAAEIAARTDLVKNKGVKQFCDLVDEQFSHKNPDFADTLKLAKLLEANPAVAEQIEKIRVLREKLERERKVRVEPEDQTREMLPDAED